MTIRLEAGDCLEVMRGMADNSVDAIVTDPPYGLSFMGRKWDYDVPSEEIWRECLRVLKPGGHLLAFAGTRTQHRMVVRIEDAGFDIRDMIAWVYSTGFPKSMNLDRQKGGAFCGCEQKTECDLHPVRDADVSETVDSCEGRRQVLQPGMQEQGAPAEGWEQFPAAEVWGGQPGMEGRGDASPSAGELRAGAVCAGSGLGDADGAQGRLCDGAPAGNGEVDRAHAAADGGSTPPGSQSAQQHIDEPRIVAGQPGAQASGAWPTCGWCGKPRIPSGLGTALKPALEPITVARKRLAGTVAANVLAHGTGALNIDGCRVPTSSDADAKGYADKCASVVGLDSNRNGAAYGEWSGERQDSASPLGRWPANLIHDGSEEVVAGFPQSEVSGSAKNGTRSDATPEGIFGKLAQGRLHNDTGSAARFFYCAKASKKDRDEGLEGFTPQNNMRVNGPREDEAAKTATLRANHHPTVKPTDLMRYLCRLVTPPGGVVLDPFMGSGSTGKAAVLEGFGFIGIERDERYHAIAWTRVMHAFATGRGTI